MIHRRRLSYERQRTTRRIIVEMLEKDEISIYVILERHIHSRIGIEVPHMTSTWIYIPVIKAHSKFGKLDMVRIEGGIPFGEKMEGVAKTRVY
ncbi:MAG: hypothetical protein K2O37_06680, partial [Bacteroidales bacterium]|nr:hypothetical protein [Bacteroidales bacterium]